jgi:hypothetical protein
MGTILLRRRTFKSRLGNTVTEFALWLPVAMMAISGMIDLSWYLSRFQSLQRIARDSCRVAAATYEDPELMPGTLTIPAAQDHADLMIELMELPWCEDGCDVVATHLVPPEVPFEQIQVQVFYQFTPLLGIWPITTDLSAQFTMAAEFGETI